MILNLSLRNVKLPDSYRDGSERCFDKYRGLPIAIGRFEPSTIHNIIFARFFPCCNLCHTGHPAEGVSLFVAPRTGAAGKNGNTVGTYICADLACSLYIRGLRPSTLPQGETLSVEARVQRLKGRLAAFVDKALTG